MRRTLVAFVVGLSAACAAPSTATAATGWLDTHEARRDGAAGPLKLDRLKRKVRYVAVVTGTFSQFSAGAWRMSLCGTPDRSPIFPSAKVRNGRVGADAEYIFADKARNCSEATPAVRPYNGFQLAVGKRWKELPLPMTVGKPVPVTEPGALPIPREDHAYQYALVGTGKQVRFRLRDPNTRDNYGRFRITIRRAAAKHCRGDFWMFGDATEAACIAGIRGLPVPTTSSPTPTAG